MKSLSLVAICFFLLGSCSWRKNQGDSSVELLTTLPNRWFSVNKNHSLVNSSGEALPHFFFDTYPELSSNGEQVNVIVSTPAESDHSYRIDLNSGQRHYSHSYCKQKDVWNSYSGTINRPQFSIAHIPRVLDQLGEAQKVIVWSNRKAFHENALTNYHRVKLVAAFVEQVCPDSNCLGKSNWLSRLVFLGVDAQDQSLTSLSTIEEIKKNLSWETTKANLENIDGRNFIGDQSYPAVRVGQLIPFQEAYSYFKKRSLFFTDKELKKVQKGCHILYDRLWDEVGKERPEDLPANTIAELNAKIKLRQTLKEQKKPVGFAQRFHSFTKKYATEISTCEKFVYHGNINLNEDAFWFLSYTGLFYKLHREGYFYDCKNRAWQRNVLNQKGESMYNLKRDISDCKEAELDQAMNHLPNFLKSLKNEKEYFRFIDYDNHSYGTHSKLYSWVKVKSLRMECSNNPNLKIVKEMELFPEDVQWKSRNVKDIADKMKIIF